MTGPADQAGVARRIVDAATAVPGVTGLHGGTFGEIATYLPGERIAGVRVDDDAATVHIVVDYTHGVQAVADRVVAAASEAAGLPVSVVVEDIVTPGEAVVQAAETRDAAGDSAEKPTEQEIDPPTEHGIQGTTS